jgi:hypothetical protein
LKFIADAEARKLNEATLYKYRLLFRQLDSFAEAHNLQRLKQLDLDTLATFPSRVERRSALQSQET